MSTFSISELRMRRGCQAIDPRDGTEKERLKEGPDLQMMLEGHVIFLISGAETVAVPFASVAGARIKRISSTTVGVPAPNSGVRKGEVSE
jgi:hypothetical protein